MVMNAKSASIVLIDPFEMMTLFIDDNILNRSKILF